MKFTNQQKIIKLLSIIIISHNINSSNFTITPIIIGATGVTMIIGGLQSHIILSDKSLSKYDSFKDCAKVIPGILSLGMISIIINYYMLRLFYTLHTCAILAIFAICIRVNAKYYAIYTHTCEAISCIHKQEFGMFLEKALLAYTEGNTNHEYCKLAEYIKTINTIEKEARQEYNQEKSPDIKRNKYISHFAEKITDFIDKEINSLLDHAKGTDGDSKRQQILLKAAN